MTAIAPLVTGFLREHLPQELGCSPHTCATYTHALRILLVFASRRLRRSPSDLALEDLSVNLVLDFLAHLETRRGNSPATRNGRLAAVKAFMRYVELREPAALAQAQQIRAIPPKREAVPLIRHLIQEEVEAILDAPDLSTRLGIRDRAMIHLCYAAGLRVSELVNLPLDGLELQGQPSVRVLGKGRRERNLPLWKQTARDLRGWLAVRGSARGTQLFLNARGLAMTRSGFEYVLTKHTRAASQSCPSLASRSVSPHQLRHSCAVLMLQATRDIRKVALWLGHADIRTTEVYLKADPTEKLEAIEEAVPPSLRKGHFKPPDDLIASLFSSPEV